MQPVKITVKDGIGREVNPYNKPSERHCITDWDVFEQSIEFYRCPELANTKPGEVVLAVLAWQERSPHGNWINVNEPDRTGGYVTRQIWRLVPKEEKAKSYRKSQKVLLTNNKRAEIIYPSDITHEDIQIIQVDLHKLLTPPTLK